MFRLIKQLNDAPSWSAKHALILIAMLLPCTAFSIGLSAFSMVAECEADCKDAQECLTASPTNQLRKNRIAVAIRNLQDSIVKNHSTLVVGQAAEHIYLGHRLPNGLLAPLKS